jgi:ketosteroid isomerase-like protein
MRPRINSRSASLIAALLVIAVIAAPACGEKRQPKRHTLKQQVEALEEQWRVTQLANDVVSMDKLLSEDFIGISVTGQIYTKVQQLERMRTKKLMLTKIELSEMKVKLVGPVAIVTSRADVEGTNDDAPLTGTLRYMRVYRRVPSGGWKITSFEATRVPGPKQHPRLDEYRDPATEHLAPTTSLSSVPSS